MSTKEQGGTTTAKLILDTILFMSNDVVTEFQFSLEGFGRNSLDSLVGENVAVVIYCLLSVNM